MMMREVEKGAVVTMQPRAVAISIRDHRPHTFETASLTAKLAADFTANIRY
jgi:hypothetical protein